MDRRIISEEREEEEEELEEVTRVAIVAVSVAVRLFSILLLLLLCVLSLFISRALSRRPPMELAEERMVGVIPVSIS